MCIVIHKKLKWPLFPVSLRSDSRCCQSFLAIKMACFQFESFVTVLRKLCTNDFSSEKLPRHCSIRRQAEKLLQSPNVL